VKGEDQMAPLEFQWSEYLSPLLKLGWCQWVGAAIFFWGWLHQRHCHAILVSYSAITLSVFGDWTVQVISASDARLYVLPISHGQWKFSVT